MENKDEYRVVKIPFFKKIWLSITKFERYPEMATEGVGKAISYLIKLILIFAIIISSCMIYNFHNYLQQGIKNLNENVSEINYKDGTLEIKPLDEETMNVETEIGTLIVDTNIVEEEKIREYEKSIKKDDLGIIWLSNKVVLYAGGMEEAYYYGDILGDLEITEFNKTDLINYFTNNNTLYIFYFVIMIILTFVAYFITTLLDILVLSVFGLLSSYMTGIKIRYRAIFNMSIYALTLSIILRMLYIIINIFTDYTIKYFDFMYTAIGYICLVASIFMIKSDVIKQQLELIKIREQMKEQKEQEAEEKNRTEEKEEKSDKKNEKDEKQKEDTQKEPTTQDDGAENQGSHA